MINCLLGRLILTPGAGGEEGVSPINILDLTYAVGIHNLQKIKPADAIYRNFQ